MKTERRRYETDEEALLREERDRLELVSSAQRIEDIKNLMATDWGRREAYRMLRQGLQLPGQKISNQNGSLQSYQLGRSDCTQELDDVIRFHCNPEWLVMLRENKHKSEDND